MEQFEILYRALKNTYDKVGGSVDLDQLFSAVLLAPKDQDKLESERSYCVIDEKWVEKIEKEIVFVEKAIAQERQFIIKTGEVVPIQKVRKVSDASVRHLARHANLLTKMPKEGQDIIPDKLYMVENLTDYAVYENRFLYLLLTYLRDFIAIRLNEIIEIGNTYKANFTISKDVRYKKRHLVYRTEIYDEDKNDAYAYMFNKSLPLVNRIKDLQSITFSLLSTELMQAVAKVPMIRPPIVSTNVLKMNNNFVHALELYHYLSSYEGKGFSVEKVKNEYRPLTEDMLGKYSKIIALSTFFTYVYGNKFGDMFEAEYKEYLKAEQKKALEQVQQRLDRLMQTHGENYPSYVLELEQRNKYLNNIQAEYDALAATLEGLKNDYQNKLKENEKLLGDLKYYQTELDDKLMKLTLEQQQHSRELLARDEQIKKDKLGYEQSCQALKAEYDKQVLQEKAQFDGLYQEQVKAHKSAMDDELQQRKQSLDENYRRYEQENDEKMRLYFEQCSSELTQRRQLYSDREKEVLAEMDKLRQENERLKNERIIAVAELNALRQKNGLMTNADDFTSKERFNELEDEFEAFFALFKSQWKQTKKRIRREILWKLKRDGEMRYEQFEQIEKEIAKDEKNQQENNFILDENFKNSGSAQSTGDDTSISSVMAQFDDGATATLDDKKD